MKKQKAKKVDTEPKRMIIMIKSEVFSRETTMHYLLSESFDVRSPLFKEIFKIE